jgi:hypothetical protein
MIEVIEGPMFDIRAGGYRKSLVIVLSETYTSKERGEVLVFQLNRIFKGRNQKRWRLLKKIRSGKEDYIVRVIPNVRLPKLNFPKYEMTAKEIIELGGITSLDIIDSLRHLEKEKS